MENNIHFEPMFSIPETSAILGINKITLAGYVDRNYVTPIITSQAKKKKCQFDRYGLYNVALFSDLSAFGITQAEAAEIAKSVDFKSIENSLKDMFLLILRNEDCGTISHGIYDDIIEAIRKALNIAIDATINIPKERINTGFIHLSALVRNINHRILNYSSNQIN